MTYSDRDPAREGRQGRQAVRDASQSPRNAQTGGRAYEARVMTRMRRAYMRAYMSARSEQ